jgi:hypothetical protein
MALPAIPGSAKVPRSLELGLLFLQLKRKSPIE